MNIIQRIGLRLAGVPAAKALTRPTWWDYVGGRNALGEGGIYGNNEAGWRGAVNSNVWAYNSVKARMALVAQAPLKLYAGTGKDRKEIDAHPALEVLREVNPINLNARSLMRGIEQQLSVYGRCLVHKVRAVKLAELFILPKEYVEVVPDAGTYIGGYRWLPTGDVIPREDVIDFFYPSVDGSVDADSPASVALHSVNRYNLADKAQAAIDKRGGQKGGLVIHPKDEINEDFYRIRDEWDRKRSDPDNAGRDMHVPFGTGFDGNAFSATEMQREERNQRLAKEIMAAFSVPPAAAGDYRDASVLANAATQMSTFWTLWGADELKFIAEELTYSLLWAEYPDAKKAGYYFEYDLTGIQALREDADALANRAIVLYQGNVATLNEARALAGFDKIDDPQADTITQVQVDSGQPADVAGDVSEVVTDDTPADDELAGLTDEVDALLAEIDDTAAKAVGKPEKGDRDGDGIFNEGAKVSPVTGRSLAVPKKEEKPKKAKKAPKTEEQKQAERDAKVKAKREAQVQQLSGELDKLNQAWERVKDDPNVDPKLKKKLQDTQRKIQAKRDSLQSGQSEATSGVLNELAAAGKAMPIVDFVGMMAVNNVGNELGTIEKIHRFGTFDGIEATKAVPVVVIAGKAYNAGDVKVVLNG